MRIAIADGVLLYLAQTEPHLTAATGAGLLSSRYITLLEHYLTRAIGRWEENLCLPRLNLEL